MKDEIDFLNLFWLGLIMVICCFLFLYAFFGYTSICMAADSWFKINVINKPAEISMRHLWIHNVDSDFKADGDQNLAYRWRKGFFYIEEQPQNQSTLTSDVDVLIPTGYKRVPACPNKFIPTYRKDTIEYKSDVDLSTFSVGIYPYDMKIKQIDIEINPWIGLGYCRANDSDPFLSVEGGFDFVKHLWRGLHAIGGVSYFKSKPEEYNFDSARAFLGLGWRF